MLRRFGNKNTIYIFDMEYLSMCDKNNNLTTISFISLSKIIIFVITNDQTRFFNVYIFYTIYVVRKFSDMLTHLT